MLQASTTVAGLEGGRAAVRPEGGDLDDDGQPWRRTMRRRRRSLLPLLPGHRRYTTNVRAEAAGPRGRPSLRWAMGQREILALADGVGRCAGKERRRGMECSGPI